MAGTTSARALLAALSSFSARSRHCRRIPGSPSTRSSATRAGCRSFRPHGAWGEVINATPRWLVIQNHSGQQYPIALEDIGEFLVRWPASVTGLGPESVVEAVGNDLGSNVVEVTSRRRLRGYRSHARRADLQQPAGQQRRGDDDRPHVQPSS